MVHFMTSQPGQKKKGPLFWVLFGCGAFTLVGGLCIGGIILAALMMTDAPFDATHVFFDRIDSGDLDGAYASCTAEFQASVSREEFDEMFVGLAISDLTITNRNVNSELATMTGTVMLSDGSNFGVVVYLSATGDRWNVQRIDGQFAQHIMARAGYSHD